MGQELPESRAWERETDCFKVTHGVMEMSYIMIVLLYHDTLFKTNQIVPSKLLDFIISMSIKLMKNIKKYPYERMHRWVSQLSV